MGFSSPWMALTIYSVAIIILPIVIFYTGKSLSETFIKGAEGNIYGAISAVIGVHVILIAFVYRAFQEEKQFATQQRGQKAD